MIDERLGCLYGLAVKADLHFSETQRLAALQITISSTYDILDRMLEQRFWINKPRSTA
jgi:hypothetical protein